MRNGSRRKRDLAAVAAAETEVRAELVRGIDETPLARATWAQTVEKLRASLPGSTFELWLHPLVLLGERDGALYLSAPDTVRAWIERRYMRALEQAAGREVRLLDPRAADEGVPWAA